MIVGGAIVVALFAALIVPWFVNWDDYKTNFEQEASRILGHPVSVRGSATASILPSPSLTFTDVRVGPTDSAAMMTVDRFEVTIELMPLLQGEIRVTTMRLDRPSVRISVDEAGAIDWLNRPAASEGFDPDKVVLAGVSVSDGTIAYVDARTGVALEFAGITAVVEARSLAGPWRAEGSYRDGATAVPFILATGRRLDDGTIRLKADISPSQWPIDVSADGVVSHDPVSGLAYAGTYTVGELVENITGEAAPEGVEPEFTGWRSDGAFTLTGERLSIDKAVLSHGPADRPTSVAGAATLAFGVMPSFDISAEARQLDLDRALGGGPTEPVDVAAATEEMVAWLAALPIPNIPGRIAVDVPAIVVGGSVIQDVAFSAAPAAGGWRIEGLRARLPGQATITADGVLATGSAPGFAGSVRLAVQQPATFASWWRGGANQGAGRLLSAFDISGTTEVAPARISVGDIQAQVGGATITGRFAWSDAQRNAERHLGTDLKADRIDFAQLKALAELLVGRDLTDVSVLADSYSVILAAERFDFDDVSMTDVAINAEYSDDVLKIVRFSIGDLGGSSFRVTSGRIDEPTTNPRGELTAELEAESVDGLALLAGRFFPGSGLLEWLGRSADVITPAYVSARVVAPPEPGGTGFRIGIADGVAGATTFDFELESRAAMLANWRDEPARILAVVASPDSGALARQIGFAASSSENDGGAHVDVRSAGIPKDGLDTTVIAEFAGVTANAAGVLVVADDLLPTFSGNFGVSSADLGTLMATAGLSIPEGQQGTAAELDGTLDLAHGKASVAWNSARIAERVVSGAVTLSRGGDVWRLDGDLSVDEVDIGWLMAIGLGSSPFPTGDRSTPWPKAQFAAPGYGSLAGKLTIAAERATFSDTLAVSGARLALALQPQRLDLDLSEGHFAGGNAAGGVSIHNVDGNANVTGQFTLAGASLESLAWRLQERAVATGILDLSVNFEAIGRSAAGLISSGTGGGVVSIHDGEARYIDPTSAARQIIRASDLGQEFTEDALRISLAEQIGADSLRFGEIGGAFTIAGGSIRLRGLSVTAPNNMDAAGNAVLDLNAMTIDSDWTLTFDPGDTKVEGIEPKIGIVFRGPLAEPERIIDALPFGSYLNTRREARILEIIAREEADRAEREWFGRVALKLRQETERAERLAREAAEAERLRMQLEAAAGARLENLHIGRELRAEQRLANDLAHWAERLATAREAVEEASRAAAEAAGAERERANALVETLPPLVAADQQAAAVLNAARASFESSDAAASEMAERAARAEIEAAESEATLRLSVEKEEAELAASADADRQVTATKATLEAAVATASAAASVAGDLDVAASAAAADLERSWRTLSEAFATRDLAAGALSAAEANLVELEANAEASGANKAAAAREATAALTERDRLQTEVNAAVESADVAVAARDAVAEAYRETEAALAEAATALAEATQLAANAVAIAEALAAEQSADASASQETARAMQLRQAVKRAEVDRLRQELDLATPKVESAEAAAGDALSRASMAKAALEAAAAIAEETSAAAAQAMMGNASLLNMLSQSAAARDNARVEATTRENAAQLAGAAFNDAETRAAATVTRAEDARADAATAEAARRIAANAVATAEAAAGTRHQAAASAAIDREAAATRSAQMQADAVAARQAAEAAKAELADATAALQSAMAAADAARSARLEAEASVAAALARAVEAESAAAVAAQAAASQALAADAFTPRTISNDAINEAATAPPTLRPRRQPINLVPEAVAGDQPMVIVPAQ